MLKRVYIKGLSILDDVIGYFHLLLESKGVMKRITYTIHSSIANQVRVDHQYPVNYTNRDKALFDHYTGYETAPEIIYGFENINIAERGILFKRLNNIGLSVPHVVFRKEFGWLYLLKNYLFRKKVVLDQSKTYILLYDFWSSANYYHWLVDSLPRILSVKGLLASQGYVLLLPAECPDYIRRTLSCFEIHSVVYLQKKEFYFAHSLLLPYYLAGSGHIHPAKIREVRDFFKLRIPAENGKDRLYVSRSRQKARTVVNEREVLLILKEYGFRTVYFEDYNFEEQVRLVSSAAILVSSHGANMTNLMFMAQGTRCLELIRELNPNFCYWALATVTGINYYYQLCPVKGNDHLLVDVSLLRKNLEMITNG